ncbi:UDP-N-acetylmuramoyl-L-alanyl-D-glutamate--2,6-diaminopimelate ligase [Myxococcota bacterium]|nr:UDP-N-acetylmuramoyl-L-alanyl-D-glutamate--2,6-diaminopimelate ligase [Myxococcota bacterium]
MRLEEIIRGIAITDRRGRFETDITGLTTDSRRVKPGELFIAVRGLSKDGHDFIKHAVDRGASAVLAESWPDELDYGRTNVVLVPSSRRALALAAANFYGQPSRKLLVAGVTGTNGKTTVTYLLESIIRAASKSVGVIGTVECRYAGNTVAIDNTTPDAIVLQQQLAEMVKAGVTHVAMEVSSHALDQQRVTGVHYKVAGFTNLTHDHLDYHKTIDTYFEAKARLFSECLRKSRARGRMAVVNVDDARGSTVLERWGGKSLSVSLDPAKPADVVALSAEYSLSGTKATIKTAKGIWDIETSLIGPHNLSNTLVAVGMALAMGFSKARIERGLRALERVPGRLERVPGDPAKHVFVDYAHTPDALGRILAALRPLTKGRLIVVFGCGGDRDATKRPLMGKAVAEIAQLAIVTNDNPRSEPPAAIAAAVEAGLVEGGFTKMIGPPVAKSYKVELDRRAAIRAAIDWAGPDDVVVVAGKGHENYQIIGTKKLRFDDREEARRILAGLPPPPPLRFDDATGEVETEQVVETLEIVDASSILSEASVSTLSIDADAIVEAVEDVSADELEVLEEAPATQKEGSVASATPPVKPPEEPKT